MQVDSDIKELKLHSSPSPLHHLPSSQFLEREPVGQLLDLSWALTVGGLELCKVLGVGGGVVVVGVGGEERPRFLGSFAWRRKGQPPPVSLPRNPMDRKFEELQYIGSQRVRYDFMTKQQHFDIHKVSSLISSHASLSTNSLSWWDQSRSPIY